MRKGRLLSPEDLILAQSDFLREFEKQWADPIDV